MKGGRDRHGGGDFLGKKKKEKVFPVKGSSPRSAEDFVPDHCEVFPKRGKAIGTKSRPGEKRDAVLFCAKKQMSFPGRKKGQGRFFQKGACLC